MSVRAAVGALVDGLAGAFSALTGNTQNKPLPSMGRRDGYIPNPSDIVALRRTLVKALKLPAGIVDEILDFAEYWACNSNEIDFIEEHGNVMMVNAGSSNENKFLLRSFPVGFTGGLEEDRTLAEQLAYDTKLPRPYPLEKEHEADFFTNLASYPTPSLYSPVRKIVFSIRSSDQGWGGDVPGTFQGSSTWFEAGLERFDARNTCNPQCVPDLRYTSRASQAPELPLCSLRPIEPLIELVPSRSDEEQEQEDNGPEYEYSHPLWAHDVLSIQRNRVATREFADHCVTWRWDDSLVDPDSEEEKAIDDAGRGKSSGNGEFVRRLKMGDVVTIWAKARYAGWVNNIERVSVDIYWAV